MTRRDLLQAAGALAMGGVAARAGATPLAALLESPQVAPRASFTPDVDLELTAAPAKARILAGQETDVWRFTGRLVSGPRESLQPAGDSYLGPTIRVHRGQRVRVRFRNRLPDPSIVHWHGLDVPESADGHPRFAVEGGREYTYEFEVTNRAGTYWYHPHPHMQTGPQVYSGLAGLFVVSDDHEAALGLPSGAQDLTVVLQDRRFDASNQLVYSTAMMDMETGFLGNRVLANGRERPTWPLATRAYRVRVLNGSNARIYKLAWSDSTPVTVLGTDGGLLQQPRTSRFVTLAPAQRVDLWLDLGQRPVGATLDLVSAAFELRDAGLDMSGMGMTGRGMGRGMGAGRGAAMSGGADAMPLGAPVTLLSIRVARRESAPARLPDRLSTFDRSWLPAAAPVRRVPIAFQMMEWMLDGRTFDMADVSPAETVDAGTVQRWEFVNAGGPMGMQMAHPMHIHGRQFRVLSRTGGAAANTLREGLVDDGWMDTVLVLPQETVSVQMPISAHRGLFLYHCHILEHEDMGMMRNFRIR